MSFIEKGLVRDRRLGASQGLGGDGRNGNHSSYRMIGEVLVERPPFVTL